MARNDEIDIDDIDDNDPDAGSQLRKYAKAQAAKASKVDELERRLAFAEAGIDTSTRKGAAFAATYDGDISDRQAILADAQEFDPGILRGALLPEQASTTPETKPTMEPTGTAERNALNDGALPSDAAKPDVATQSVDRGRQLLSEGKPQEVAGGELIAMRARALANGDIAPLAANGRTLS